MLTSKATKLISEGKTTEAIYLVEDMKKRGYPSALVQTIEAAIRAANTNKSLDRKQHSKSNAKNKTTRALCIINNADKMTHQYRCHNLAEALQSINSNVSISFTIDSSFGKDYLSQFDIIVCTRRGLSLEALSTIKSLQAKGLKLLFDVDDFIFDPDMIENIRHIASNKNRSEEFSKHAERLLYIARAADICTGSTNAICKRLGELTNNPAFLVPNNISIADMDRSSDLVARRHHRKTKHTRIGYFSGTKSHEHDFNKIRKALTEVMNRRNDIEFMICGELHCDEFKRFGDRFIRLQLQPHPKMLEYLSTCHINLAPLEIENPFVHGKSELKIFESALYQIPSIASASDTHTSIIRHGSNGFIATNEAEWASFIDTLVDNNNIRNHLGEKALESIASRFDSRIVAREVHEIYNSLVGGTLRKHSRKWIYSEPNRNKVNTIKLSVITILYRKDQELPYFLDSMSRQTFSLPYEIIFIDDCDPGEGGSIVEEYEKVCMMQPYRNHLMSIRLIRNESNIGNCASRNLGIKAADGDILVVVDADCLFGKDFLQYHYDAHISDLCDVAIGPKGIETRDQHPLHILNICEISKDFALSNASPQDKFNDNSFINTVTRNFSIAKKFLCKVKEPLFDTNFSYSSSPSSGFGWEDVELGVRLKKLGARFSFLDNTFSIHISHPPTVENKDKPFRSLLNFDRLLSKHPELPDIVSLWFAFTSNAILKWCEKVDPERANIDQLCSKFKNISSANAYAGLAATWSQSRSIEKLRIATYRWHCPHQYELFKVGAQFSLINGLGHRFFDDWEYRKRPMPLNARFVSKSDFVDHDYDLAIIHFDENVLNPELCNGYVPDEWGNGFKLLAESSIKRKIFLCHGTPQFEGQYNPDIRSIDKPSILAESMARIKSVIGNNLVVCNSHQAQQEWGFSNSVVIWQGFTPSDYSILSREPASNKQLRVLSLPTSALKARPIYNGYQNFIDLRQLLNDKSHITIDTLQVENPPGIFMDNSSEWAQVKYQFYIKNLSSYDVYLNTTVRSPMPRTRGEAMMAGLCTISFRNHDIDQIIENGIDGFVVDSAEDAAEIILMLQDDHITLARIQNASRRKALSVFGQGRYLREWCTILCQGSLIHSLIPANA